MEIFAFILIGGIWAAFLLPSFFANRKKAPSTSTRSFARNTALLASVANSSTSEVTAKHLASARRQRTLVLLAIGAVVSLVLAIIQNSVILLGFSLVFDLTIAVFVTMLLFAKQQRAMPRVAQIALPPEEVAGPDPQRHTVRVVAS